MRCNKTITCCLSYALILLVAGCMSSLSAHQNFLLLMDHNIGSSIDSPRLAGSALEKYLIESKQLPNGNTENEYLERRSCRIFFEFDSDTRIIVAWRYRGDPADCGIAPV
jgi:hypothetical protein